MNRTIKTNPSALHRLWMPHGFRVRHSPHLLASAAFSRWLGNTLDLLGSGELALAAFARFPV